VGKLIELQEEAKRVLDATEYFSQAPAIPVFTEKLKSVFQTLQDAESENVPLSVSITTVDARDAENQIRGNRGGAGGAGSKAIIFKNTMLVIHCIENPDFNLSTGIRSSDMAEAVVWFLPLKFHDIAPLKIESIIKVEDPKLRVSAAIFSMEAEITRPPARPILNTDGQPIFNTDGVPLGG